MKAGKSYHILYSSVLNQQLRLEELHDIAKILDVNVDELIVSSKLKNEK